MIVNGLCFATGWSQLGIDATGTNADETNVSGKRIVKPYAFDASGDDAVSPMNANTHENEYPIKSSSAIPATMSGRRSGSEADGRPTPTMTTSWIMFVLMSASVRPVTTAERDIGSDRNRSISPFFRSSDSPSAVTNPPKAIVWTMIPGIRKST